MRTVTGSINDTESSAVQWTFDDAILHPTARKQRKVVGAHVAGRVYCSLKPIDCDVFFAEDDALDAALGHLIYRRSIDPAEFSHIFCQFH